MNAFDPSARATSAAHPSVVDPRLERGLRRMVCIGLVLVLALPAARGYSQWLGWMPLWLLGMPLAAWWGLHRFRLPPRRPASRAPRLRQRRTGPQARRRRGPQRLPRAA